MLPLADLLLQTLAQKLMQELLLKVGSLLLLLLLSLDAGELLEEQGDDDVGIVVGAVAVPGIQKGGGRLSQLTQTRRQTERLLLLPLKEKLLHLHLKVDVVVRAGGETAIGG